MSKTRQIVRAGAVAAVLAAFGFASPGVASAHVTAQIYGAQPQQGGYTAITLRVPNEDDKAGTDKLTVHIDKEYALASVRTKPVPGWTAEITRSKLDEPITTSHGAEVTEVVTSITWTAEKGSEIPAGEESYQEFSFTAGPLPEVDRLILPADQHYTNGTTVSWADEDPEGEKPAPVVELAPASGDGHSHGGGAATAHDDADANAAESEQDSVDTTARWLGGVGLAVGALGAGAGIGAVLRSRKKVSS
ncbi:MAG: YcnI family protein [Thermocrispum agreste]|uniref:Nuclear export factor GLE1 n=1 Tax=Thermocrispum agreste TaxID=37925 RepID=A0A2W4IX93_9PSEU|nr:MAG: nuclear export factor GLE1 [Thermocrispum agreste]